MPASTLTATSLDLDPLREDLAPALAKWGDSASSTWLETTRHRLFEAPHHSGADDPAVQGYLERDEWAFAWGDPIVRDRSIEQRFKTAVAWIRSIEASGRTPIYCCVSEELEQLLANRLGWSALTCVKEDLLKPENIDLSNKDLAKNIRRSNRAGVEIIALAGPPEGPLKAAVEQGLAAWERKKSNSLAAQALQPWIDAKRRRYWLAMKGDEPLAIAVLAPIKDGGWQIKDAIAFPWAPKGVSEHLISTLLEDLRHEGALSVSFGISADSELVPVSNLNGWKITWLSKAYKRVLKTTGLTKRGEFRHKFGVEEQPLYVAYPPKGLGWDGIQALIKVLRQGNAEADAANGAPELEPPTPLSEEPPQL